ncbi:succinylglutamate desuccinylase/aspartoacylase family protein [Sinorhizobium meliloti]|uniref:Peptidase M14 n=3 Tax=Rhizobium meliloti TaxID=382 RepID=A0A6A8A3R4_RHIML|nr:succinylglutamate desuccinylase/aspartoacylase family protein [Sinorhizobium meliloti]MDW9374713.1 peptidase M14 [Sinorhizobium meliloti]MDW9415860.1 peptidase M14 [Sinorhizobium meliloti]MDW9480666.1 peptidase M14 [Sinorhizobium meliloti]MDW9492230.1 peptidase M14 [Sinorhizobium meliloti]MDW9512280.1 peptidase M14 [Sinorhizobium meliloti]
MDISEIIIAGDTPGVEWRLPVFRFKGASAAAPRTYIQAALHANELPGTALLHFLLEKLCQADEDGAILGDIAIVPQANPIGAAQAHFGELQGRFDLGSRTNFNRDFPLISLGERDGLLDEPDRYSAIDRLKRHLLDMALGAELVLDLHCDDEGLQYAYIDEAFWPEAADLAAALDMEAVFLSDGQSSAFEEAVAHAWKHESEGERRTALPGRLSVTVELRGTRDVYPDIALKDAEGMFRFLAGRGVVASTGAGLPAFAGKTVPLDNIEMIRAPETGAILFHRNIGDNVEAGELLATILVRPGVPGGTVEVRAPQDGLIVTRVSTRLARRRSDLMKIACAEPSRAARKPGTLEA